MAYFSSLAYKKLSEKDPSSDIDKILAETLCCIFKTRRFCLESTHFTDPTRLRKLVALLTLALCWTIKVGLILHQIQPIALKKHGRRAKSLFSLGFEHLRELVLNPCPRNQSYFR